VSAIYYLNQDTLKTAYCLARRFELTGRLVPTDLYARSSAEMAFLWGYAGLNKQADRLFEQGWQTAQALNAPLTVARVLYSWGVFEIGRGAWGVARERLHQSATIYQQFGEQRPKRDAEIAEAYAATFTSAWDESAALYERLLHESGEHEAQVQVAWCCFGLGKIRWRQGRHGEAMGYFDRGLVSARNGSDTVSQLMLFAARASVRAAAGERAGAEADVASAVPLIAPGIPSAFMVAEGAALVAEAALALLPGATNREPLVRAATLASASLQRAAKVFPAARPIARHWREQIRGAGA
jgi:tetratricopeptide (TPR) repeat protein